MKLETNVPLKELTNLKIGGKAKFFVTAKDVETIAEAVLLAKNKKLPLFILGGGTNIVAPDSGWPGLVLHIKNSGIKRTGDTMEAEAGTLMAELLEASLNYKLSGLEWSAGLPGTLGGAIRGNAGAFGGEISDNLTGVVAMDSRTGETKRLKKKECEFAYRESVFKHKPLIILSAALNLDICRDWKKSRGSIQEKLAFRRKKHPLEFPNVGSVFQNLTHREDVAKVIKLFPSIKERVARDWHGKVPTAFLIERAEIKGLSLGGAQVSPRHANFIVNYKDSTAADFTALMKLVQQIIRQRFDITLKPEIEIVSAENRE